MKSFRKIFGICIISLFIVASVYAKTDKIDKKDREINKHTIEKIEKKGDNNKIKTPCYQKSGAQEKMQEVKSKAEKRIIGLQKLNTSLNNIISLLGDNNQANVFKIFKIEVLDLIAKYTTIIDRIDHNPQSMCGAGPVLKPYNESSKILIKKIKDQIAIFKNKKS